jgi:hypothetical protein
MTWRTGLPPKSGTYRVKWDPEDRVGTLVHITLVNSPHGEDFAVWRYPDDPSDDPEVYPGTDTPYAVWLDESPIVGSPTPAEAILSPMFGETKKWYVNGETFERRKP